MGSSWQPKFCVYDVCLCGHAFMEHGKRCVNTGYWDVENEVIVPTESCGCRKFEFKHPEIMRKHK
jgi:hypothetical protein